MPRSKAKIPPPRRGRNKPVFYISSAIIVGISLWAHGQSEVFKAEFLKVDFAALKDFAANVRHVVFEPSQLVEEERLRAGIAHIRSLWGIH